MNVSFEQANQPISTSKIFSFELINKNNFIVLDFRLGHWGYYCLTDSFVHQLYKSSTVKVKQKWNKLELFLHFKFKIPQQQKSTP